MKRLGVIGGIGPESTIVYYRALVAAGRERLEGAAPSLLINSIDVQTVLRLAEEDPVPGLRDYLLGEIGVLARCGVSIGLIAANTPHMVFDEVRQRSPVQLVSTWRRRATPHANTGSIAWRCLGRSLRCRVGSIQTCSPAPKLRWSGPATTSRPSPRHLRGRTPEERLSSGDT
jgi:hypothetical protein